jgi:hypothetical protein
MAFSHNSHTLPHPIYTTKVPRLPQSKQSLHTKIAMAPRLRRPEVNATINICSRTLVGELSPEIQVAHHPSFQLTHPKSQETIPAWAAELELDILVGFGIDPKYYAVRIHDSTPSNQPCPKEQELKTLKDVGLDQIATGPYEVHFLLKEGVKPPTTEALREWQQRWADVNEDPTPLPRATLRETSATASASRLP